MVTDFLIGFVIQGLTGLLTLLPAWTAPTGTSATNIGGMVYEGNRIFPMSALVWTILAGLAVEGLLRLWDLSVWVFHQFWGSD